MHAMNCECRECRRERHETAADAVMAEFHHRFGDDAQWGAEERKTRLALELVQHALLMLQAAAP